MIRSFLPIVNSDTEILILGTMPGVASLSKQEYYGNPKNHFWKIIYSLYSTLPVSEVFEEKKQLILANKIGLWDVLENCERKGSLDIHIKNHKENDFEILFEKYPSIKMLIFNGKESHKYFLKKYGPLEGITYCVMPSSSPANTMSFENKLKIWSTCFQ
ncbi:DNA-deoxyinosine glycosylase [Flavobacterium sp. 123]|uniref:DNA-deoxyinosine glycosylase n=1 Tax=Flavobacterium sp. 123 TaxID=2135627 RepID=UPI000EAF4DA0|nr:DNA-deoxyinosine glycosylase [Flavobacterium sp. 123]RKT00777.1 G/U mismatch-specific uracil-DNA glycosylase [Flavobacterium sp. 123]